MQLAAEVHATYAHQAVTLEGQQHPFYYPLVGTAPVCLAPPPLAAQLGTQDLATLDLQQMGLSAHKVCQVPSDAQDSALHRSSMSSM